jgi:hypothetical protein
MIRNAICRADPMRVRLPTIGLAAVPHHICLVNDVWLAVNGLPEDKLGAGYAVPVRQLLSIGEARSYDPAKWPDYCARFALGREHISDLIRIACDAVLHLKDPLIFSSGKSVC